MEDFLKYITNLRNEHQEFTDFAKDQGNKQEEEINFQITEVLNHLLEQAPTTNDKKKHLKRYNKHFSRSNN